MNKNDWLSEFDPDIVDVIFKLKVKLPNGKTISKNFSIDLGINYDLLEEQLEQTPTIFAFLSSMLSEQRHICNKLELQIAKQRSRIVQHINETAKSENMKVPKHIIDDMVETDEVMTKLQSQLLLEQRSLGKLYGLVDAIRMKSEHLRSLAGFKRQEMKNS